MIFEGEIEVKELLWIVIEILELDIILEIPIGGGCN